MIARLTPFVTLGLATVLLDGCTSAAQKAAAAKNQDWLRTQAVYVKPFSAEDALTVGTGGSAKGIANQIAKGIAKALREYHSVNATYVKDGEVPSPGGVVVEGELGRVFLGDARTEFIGFTQAKATCSASGRATQDGRLVGEFHADSEGDLSPFQSDNFKMLDECTERVAEDIADQIASGRYRAADD